MNPLCPNCQTELTDDFGLVDCKSCGAVCLIDLEDNVVVQGDEPIESEDENLENEEVYGSSEETEEENADEADGEEYEEEYEESLLEDGESNEEPQPEEDLESEEEGLYDESGLIEAGNDESDIDGEEDAVESVPTPRVPVAPLSGEDFLKDLEVFSEEATADGGHIYYDFHVTGIEGAQLRENFIETLADSRLEISEDSIREILGDSLDFTLPQISFLRLTVIYKRLLSLELEMSWTLSELQEPATYLSEEIEEVDLYGEEDEIVYEEPEDDEY